MSNTIQIKHGNGVPNRVLEPYELGYSIDKKSLYIGAPLVNGQKTDAIPVTAEIVEKAKKLEAERTISVNLATNTSEAFDGSKDVSLGVTGILPLKNGGLGVDASQGVLSALGISATTTELNYVDGVTSAIQTQLNNKLAKTAGTASRVMISNSSKSITTSSVTSTELGYLSGVTSNIQDQINGLGGTEITGAASTIATSNLTASRALISNASGKVAVSDVTSTELGYLDGVTSAIQTQLNGKAGNSYTASRALVSNSSGNIAVSAVTSTELGYLDGVTSAIQTQLNGKVSNATAVTGQSGNGTSNVTVITMGNLVVEHGYFSANATWTAKYFKTTFAEAPALSFIPTGSNNIQQVKLQSTSSVTKNGFTVSTPSGSATYIYMAIGRKA